VALVRAIDAERHLAELLLLRGIALTEARWRPRRPRVRRARCVGGVSRSGAGLADEPFTNPHGQRLRVNPDPNMDGELLLFESGRIPLRPPGGYQWTEDVHGPKVFGASFTRQFSFEDEAGEYFVMNGLVLTVEFDCDLDHRAQIWGNPAEVDGWRAKVERDEAFAGAFAGEATQLYFGQSNY
jgi:hypothetical protein